MHKKRSKWDIFINSQSPPLPKIPQQFFAPENIKNEKHKKIKVSNKFEVFSNSAIYKRNDKKSFIFIDLLKEGTSNFVFKYLLIDVYVYSLIGLIYSIFLDQVFIKFPFICFDSNFENLLKGGEKICFCKNEITKLITYMRRGLLMVNLIIICNLEILNETKKIDKHLYVFSFFLFHILGLTLHLVFPEKMEYFFNISFIILVIFAISFLMANFIILNNNEKKDYNIQFFGLSIMFIFQYFIYCIANATNFCHITDFFFENNLKTSIFVICFHFLMSYITSCRDVLVTKVKPKFFVKKAFLFTTNCVFSCIKMGFFMALDIREYNFYLNACLLLYSNISHTLTFVKKKLFFIFRLQKFPFCKKIGIWKICLKSNLDKKLINGSFIFERFLNYYIIGYIYFSGKYFLDPLETQKYAINCILELKEEFQLHAPEVICYFFVDFLSVFVIITLNRTKKLDEIKYITPKKLFFLKKISLLLGVYFYSHYLFVVAYYIKHFKEEMIRN